MTESLIETYARLNRNLTEAEDAYNKSNSKENEIMLNVHRTIYTDFCITFTDNMLRAAEKTMNDTAHM